MAISTELKAAVNDQTKFRAIVDRRRAARMATIDNLPPDVRACVHDYGFTVVDTLVRLGIKKSKHIRHVVETVLNEFSPTRGAASSQGTRAGFQGIGPDNPLNK